MADRDAGPEMTDPPSRGPEHPETGHEYGYGNDGEASPIGNGDDAEVGAGDGAAADELAPEDPETTPQAVRGHEPAAQIRPVPGGIAPPVSRRPGYQPPVGSVAAPGRSPRRGRLIAAIAGALVLVMLIGVGILALWRPWESAPPTGDSAGTASPSGTGAVEPGKGVEITLVGVEEGLDSLGPASSPQKPQGQYAIVTVRIRNDSGTPISWNRDMVAIGSDGTEFPADEDGTRAAGGTNQIIKPGQEAEVTVAFDVPFGTSLKTAHIAIETGTADIPLS